MITGKLKSDINKLWDEFWTGGISNPLTVIEQITYLMFFRLLDLAAAREEKKAARTGKKATTPFNKKQQLLRWSQFKSLGGEEMLKRIRDEVFPHFRDMASEESTFGRYMKDAQLMIQKPSLLVSAVSMIDNLPLDKGDTKGDLYEYVLSKLTTAGINGQFRTPRHIIRLMVELVDPKPDETVGDPACGTGGFLVAAMTYLLEKYTSKAGRIEQLDEDGRPVKDDRGNPQYIYTGDKLEPYRKHIQRDMFHGFDFDATMLRIAVMNMMLHGVDNPSIDYQDALSNSFPERFPKTASDHFDVILANPPFKGSLDHSDVHSSLTGKIKTKKTELLFPTLMLRMLKDPGGRCAVIVPDGVLFGSSKAHRDLKQMLVDDNELHAVIKLPAGVFKPYAGVSTAILYFAKGGKTGDVFFYDVQADGLSLDDKRTPVDENDLPDVMAQWNRWSNGNGKKSFADRKNKAFFVPVSDIREAKYDLSINRYKEVVYEEPEFDPPKAILKRLAKLNEQEAKELAELEGMLK
ncbi:MAG: SAM-dependent DNA methyltransferase [Phycisphaerae bacterium]|nr:SAM-dependent DNA methyltransferase [Phycisphaerae bacterium]